MRQYHLIKLIEIKWLFHLGTPHNKGIKMADPILESSLKTGLNTIHYDIFLAAI
jgi:hypothetical protein